MAQSFFDQMLNWVGLDLAKPDKNNTSTSTVNISPAVQEELDTSNMTGIEKYLAKKQVAETGKAIQGNLSGVAKYLEQKAEQQAAELSKYSGVARYLAKAEQKQNIDALQRKRAEELNSISSVTKYLTKLEAANQAKAECVEEAGEAKPSGVATYIAKQEFVKPSGVATYLAKQKKSAPITKTSDAVAEEADAVAEASNATEGTIDLTTAAKQQCQATTLKKGTQCRRTSSLETIEKSIDGQNYKFIVCGQHNNDAFAPFSGVL